MICPLILESGRKYLRHRGNNKTPRTPFDRFIDKVRMAYKSECWLWTGAFTGTQCQFRLAVGDAKHQTVSAHVVAYELWVGEVPKGHTVYRRCREKRCVNPYHLFTHEGPWNRKGEATECRLCGVRLSEETQTPSAIKQNRKVCKNCYNEYQRNYLRKRKEQK